MGIGKNQCGQNTISEVEHSRPHVETREDANKKRIRMIDCTYTNSYVVTHMCQFVASTTAPSSSTSLAKGSYLLIWWLNQGSEMKYEFV